MLNHKTEFSASVPRPQGPARYAYQPMLLAEGDYMSFHGATPPKSVLEVVFLPDIYAPS